MVLARLTARDLELLIGPRVMPLLPADARRDRGLLRSAALRTLRDQPLATFSNPEIRRTLLRNLDPGKLDELQFRLSRAGADATTADTNAVVSPMVWPVVSGFFGLDPEEMAGSVRSPPREELAPTFGLFPHQRSVVRRAYAKVGLGHGRTLIHMPTGAGKTRTAMHLVARVLNEAEPAVVCWLASSRELLDQASETFEKAWSALGNRPLGLQRLWGDYAAAPESLEDGLLIGGFAKLHAWRQRDPNAFLRLGARTRLVVVDEAHQAIAPTYRAVIEGLADAGQSDAMLGLTATPGRTWNNVEADEQLSEFFGRSKVVLEVDGYANPVEYLLQEGYLARPRFSLIYYSPERAPSASELKKLSKLDDFSDDMLEAFASDTARNLAVIETTVSLIKRGHRRIILFALSVGHARDLSAAFVAHGVESQIVTGETALSRRAAALKSFKSADPNPLVLCNFGVLTTGFDAPGTSAAVIARPTKSLVLFSQMVGRATRGPRAGGNAECEVMTVHDPSYPGFGDVAEAFFNWEDVWNDE